MSGQDKLPVAGVLLMTIKQPSPIDQKASIEQTQDCLSQALTADTAKMKNYHIRRALQYCVIPPDRQ